VGGDKKSPPSLHKTHTMAQFEEAQKIAMGNEGGYANISSDKGAETYAGISRHFHPDWQGWPLVDQKSHPIARGTIFPELSAMVDSWYDKNEWDTILGDQISDQPTADYFYDWHINSGGAVKQVQEIVGVTPDGAWGPLSLSALNAGNYLTQIHQSRLAYYKSLNEPQFEAEWLTRATNLYNKLISQTA
jgi:lysozyme family protein